MVGSDHPFASKCGRSFTFCTCACVFSDVCHLGCFLVFFFFVCLLSYFKLCDFKLN